MTEDGAVHPLVNTLPDKARGLHDGLGSGVQSLQPFHNLVAHEGGVQPLVDPQHDQGHGLWTGLGAPKQFVNTVPPLFIFSSNKLAINTLPLPGLFIIMS